VEKVPIYVEKKELMVVIRW